MNPEIGFVPPVKNEPGKLGMKEVDMIYEVKIKKPDGSLKEVISSEKLEKTYWETFYKNEENIGLVTAHYPDTVSSDG